MRWPKPEADRYSSLVIFPDAQKPSVPAGRPAAFSITSRV